MTDFNLRHRENMSTILKDGDITVAVIKHDSYSPLLLEAARLREQLEIATFVLDQLPDVHIDTGAMHEVLKASDWEGK